jgi:PKD domain/Subtilase family
MCGAVCRAKMTSLCVLSVVLTWSLTSLPAAAASAPLRTAYARLTHACPPPQAESATCFAIVRRPVAAAAGASAGVHTYTVGAGAASSGPAGGLTPGELASAYDYDPAGGSGQTVAVVDAYDDPKIEEDLAVFDSHYGLGECTKADGCFRKVNQEGSESPAALPAQDETGWSQEIALDVEMVRAVCRGCKILLVEANGADDADLATAVNEAVALGATEVSNSYGGPEQGMNSEQQAAYNHPGVVITAAGGDYGYDDWNYLLLEDIPPGMPNAPASLPSVVSVGGTSLHLSESGTRTRETVWNDDGFYDENELGAGYVTTSGCSTLFVAEPWQQGANGFSATGCGDKRLSVDVSADGDPLSGFDVYDNFDYCQPATECEEEVKKAIERYAGWETFGGTSLGTPMIASLYALAGGANGVKYPALTLYGHLGQASSLYDVTEGGDGLCDGKSALSCGEPNSELGFVFDCEGTSACDARPGYDGPSGVGTPNGLAAFTPLFPTAVITPPSSARPETSLSFSASRSSDPYPGGSVTSYSWNWGDGSSISSGVTPTHTYAVAGEYTVMLTVSDNYGLVSVPVTQLVKVIPQTVKEHEEGAAAQSTDEELAAAVKKLEAEAAAATAKRRQEEAAAKIQVLGIQEASPDATIASTPLRASKAGAVIIKISCPASDSRCIGTVTLRTLKAITSSVAGAANVKPAVLTLGTASFTLAGGKVVSVDLHLSAKIRMLLERTHTLRVRVTIMAHDPAGATHAGQTVTTLLAPKTTHATH